MLLLYFLDDLCVVVFMPQRPEFPHPGTTADVARRAIAGVHTSSRKLVYRNICELIVHSKDH